ncbi:MAG: hypothetical protein ABWZ25_15960 [Chitinophagaceae bacterium]
MKSPFYLLAIVLVLAACHQKSRTPDKPNADTIPKTFVADTLKPPTSEPEVVKKTIVPDSLIWYEDSLFKDLVPVVKAISKKEFNSYKDNYKRGCATDSGHFISGSGIYVVSNCDEICQTYLAEQATNRIMPMPSDYDQGILSMLISPECNQLMVCSSYDGPDYGDYYTYRAEIKAFNVFSGKGLHGITPSFKFYTKDWSIEDLTWVNEKTIALKIYEESRGGDGKGVHYKYIKMDLSSGF